MSKHSKIYSSPIVPTLLEIHSAVKSKMNQKYDLKLLMTKNLNGLPVIIQNSAEKMEIENEMKLYKTKFTEKIGNIDIWANNLKNEIETSEGLKRKFDFEEDFQPNKKRRIEEPMETDSEVENLETEENEHDNLESYSEEDDSEDEIEDEIEDANHLIQSTLSSSVNAESFAQKYTNNTVDSSEDEDVEEDTFRNRILKIPHLGKKVDESDIRNGISKVSDTLKNNIKAILFQTENKPLSKLAKKKRNKHQKNNQQVEAIRHAFVIFNTVEDKDLVFSKKQIFIRTSQCFVKEVTDDELSWCISNGTNL